MTTLGLLQVIGYYNNVGHVLIFLVLKRLLQHRKCIFIRKFGLF